MMTDPQDLKRAARVFKALSHPGRLQIACLLGSGRYSTQKDLIEALEAAGLRDKYKVLVGGGPVSREWATAIGADGYGKEASDAVKVAKVLVSKSE